MANWSHCGGEIPADSRRRRYCSESCRMMRDMLRNRAAHPRKTPPWHSSKTVEWTTPRSLFYELYDRYGPFDLDAAATAENALCPKFYTRADDALKQIWSGRVWLNPPYSRMLGAWMRKAFFSARHTADIVVCLVPSRTDTKWWHLYAMRGQIQFIRGRLCFGNNTHPAPFPSAIVVFRSELLRQAAA
jgi:phage N-6-adenine-methyltransferase